jgi:hypothetical protein
MAMAKMASCSAKGRPMHYVDRLAQVADPQRQWHIYRSDTIPERFPAIFWEFSEVLLQHSFRLKPKGFFKNQGIHMRFGQ